MNWSCRIHPSCDMNPSWGGQMYWCCGKTRKTAPGCKKSKHVAYMSDNEDEEENIEVIKKACILCNSPDHEATNCDKDPNIRTG